MTPAPPAGGLTPAQFIAKWSPVELSERAASQEHFCDLCRLLGQPTPAEHDPAGVEYCFEKGVAISGPAPSRGKHARGRGGEVGGAGEEISAAARSMPPMPGAAARSMPPTRGFADVWWRGKFAWEYKRKDKYADLADAYRQLCQYREALENPWLLVVSDIRRTEIHTNFPNTKKEIHTVCLDELAQPEKLALLRRVFADPESFKPGLTTWKLTENAAAEFAKIADGLRQRKHDPHAAAHFLMKCMFCLFAEDVRLLPEKLFSRLLERSKADPARLTDRLNDLFHKMREGGDFGTESVERFNGGLFEDGEALPLHGGEIQAMLIASQFDWGAVEPAIFGTLFERSLDPDKRAQIGAHYTSRDDIMLIVEPVVMAPLRREWAAVKAEVEKLVTKRRKAADKAARTRADRAIAKAIETFHERLASVRILDPACGSGNFLYVAIQQLLDLEKEVIVYAGRPEIGGALFPRVRPTQLHGIELNPYAAELAQVVIWIGYLQWMRENGFVPPRDPILAPLTTVECRDAILDLTIPTKPQPAAWPEADFIIGNPPFLGSKMFRENGLDDAYVRAVYDAFDLPKSSDLCCYWFEQARRAIRRWSSTRAGLLATQRIRGDANREVLDRISHDGGIFLAWADREWVLDGAAVHVSIVGFDAGAEQDKFLNGSPTDEINSDLTTGLALRTAAPLDENASVAFMADTKGGSFEAEWSTFRAMLGCPNPHGRPNSEVLRPWVNGKDISQRPRGLWIVDFGCDTDEQSASQYEAPFEYLRKHVYPTRRANRRASYAERWWIHAEPRPAMRAACAALRRVLVTVLTSKHRLFAWLGPETLPDHKLVVVARDDDYAFGALHSSVHELWARATGGQVREVESGFTYTSSTCFECFPLPWAPGREPVPDDAGHGDAGHGGPALQRIAAAACALNEQRERWLNPPEWLADLGRLIDGRDKFADCPAEARPLLRWSAIMAAAARDPRFKKRTLTHLYNERPTWLRLAHEQLDRAVLAAYAATDPEGGWSEDWAEVWRDTGAGQPLPAVHALAERRKEIDQRVLGNLLRLNLERASS